MDNTEKLDKIKTEILYCIEELTKIEHERNINVNEHKSWNKAFKKTNSLRKINKLATKYKTDLPHYEMKKHTKIPFLYKEQLTSPNIDKVRQAEMYLEKFEKLKFLTKEMNEQEIKSCFNKYNKNMQERKEFFK